jgi:LysW-gamma-L-lysine carboxypeptidase
MQEQAIRLLTNLLGIYSPSGKEEDIANFIAKEMKKTRLPSRHRLSRKRLGTVGEDEPVIFLCGHMDTVAGIIPLRFEEGKIYARRRRR